MIFGEPWRYAQLGRQAAKPRAGWCAAVGLEDASGGGAGLSLNGDAQTEGSGVAIAPMGDAETKGTGLAVNDETIAVNLLGTPTRIPYRSTTS